MPDSVIILDSYTATTASRKIAAAYADLPAQGGVIDCRELSDNQTIDTDPFSGGIKPVTLLLGEATFVTSSPITVPSQSAIRGVGSKTVFKLVDNATTTQFPS